MSPDRHIALDGTSNLRDLCALIDPQARRRVLRSAHLDRLSPAGLQRFAELGVAVVIDLRGTEEAAAAPALAGTTRVHLPIEPTVMAELRQHLAAGSLSAASAIAVMEETYRRYVTDHAAVFAALLQRVLAARQRPVLFHCAAGKDRTGLAAALVLMALEVDPAIVMEDYLLSNQLFQPVAPTTADIPDEVRQAVVKVRPSFLEAALAAMREGWGSPRGYIERALGMGPRERAALRQAMLEISSS